MIMPTSDVWLPDGEASACVSSSIMQAHYAHGDAVPPSPSISPTDPVNGIEGAGKAINVLNPQMLVLTLHTAEASTLFFEQLSFSLAWAVDQAYDPANPFLPGQTGSTFNADWAKANAPAIPATELYQTLNSYVVKPRVSGYNLQTFVFEPNAWAHIQILAH
jgi:hypothetical protein